MKKARQIKGFISEEDEAFFSLTLTTTLAKLESEIYPGQGQGGGNILKYESP